MNSDLSGSKKRAKMPFLGRALGRGPTKTNIYRIDDEKLSKFKNECLVSYIWSNICEAFWKNVNGGSDKYEILRV